MILPFAYWAIKKIYFRPYGMFEGYNEHFSIKSLIVTPIHMGADFAGLSVDVLLFASVLIPCLFLVNKSAVVEQRNDYKKMLISGCIALACGLFPYSILGLVPSFFDWPSRHQLLMPLGIAVLLVWLFRFLPTEARFLALATVIAGSIAVNIQTYGELYLDWSKQKELVSMIAQDSKLRQAELVAFDDHTQNARHRVYRFYEWNGLMKRAFMEESRFGLDPSQVSAYRKGDYDGYFALPYNAHLHVRRPQAKELLVRIDYASKDSSAGVRMIRSLRGIAVYRITVVTNNQINADH
jgi:hypothetical protein